MKTIIDLRKEISEIKEIRNIDAQLVIARFMIECVLEWKRLREQLDREPDNQMQSYLKGKIDILNELIK